MTLNDLEFKAEDFDKTRCLFNRMSDFAWKGVTAVLRDEANRLLRERLEKAPQVWIARDTTWVGYWHEAEGRFYPNTHIARLVCIEKLK